MQRSWRRRLSGLATDEEERLRILTAAKKVGQVLVRARQEKPLLLQRAERELSVSYYYNLVINVITSYFFGSLRVTWRKGLFVPGLLSCY